MKGFRPKRFRGRKGRKRRVRRVGPGRGGYRL